jgi:hypothetical protein
MKGCGNNTKREMTMATIDEVHVKGVEPIVQHNSSVCWLASFQMLYRWKGWPRAEVEKKIRSKQTDSQKRAEPPIADFDYMSVHGIGSQDLLPCGRALGLEWGGGEDDIKITPLLYVLDTCGPLWLAGKWNGSNHVIVLIGAKRLTFRTSSKQ